MKAQLQVSIPSQERMYQAIAERDARFDGQFYYGVLTTGVFCRPSCAARLAKRENVRFYPDRAAAEAAGFRACKRCRPDAVESDTENLTQIGRYIVEHAEERLTLKQLAERAHLSPSRFQKAFSATFGVTPKAFQDAVRLGNFKDALKRGDDVTDAIFAAGFGSTSRVYGEAARSIGMTPAAYRAGGKEEKIAYACRKSVLGPLMMAATERGVCFAQFGDSCTALLNQLKSEFPNADVSASAAAKGQALADWIEALDRFLAQRAPRPDLPLDLRGTAFQLKVWRFLLSLDAGDVVSYGEVANGIGAPKSVRAAASACGANRVGVLVPCHRVLRGNGELGGYRWGVARKRALLDIERRDRARAK